MAGLEQAAGQSGMVVAQQWCGVEQFLEGCWAAMEQELVEVGFGVIAKQRKSQHPHLQTSCHERVAVTDSPDLLRCKLTCPFFLWARLAIIGQHDGAHATSQ